MDQVHVKSSRSTSRSNPAKMACEKASKRLRTILVKASRLGVSTTEVAKLASAKKLIPQRDHGWKLAVFLLVMFGGGVIVALACTARKGCSKLEEINFPEKIQACGQKHGRCRYHRHWSICRAKKSSNRNTSLPSIFYSGTSKTRSSRPCSLYYIDSMRDHRTYFET
ncbi:hypothetical protein HZU73_06725 [Apis mellifera caucasica]|uniref:Uncharacterized protein LOC100577222 isoform X1 n=1 Tax=Apis mellifera TaxID=7460 RepID=A0A7M7GNE3_APIME|nr:uncharacterized protein LOC100577222 isoform X1 [Apis mellifera]KAG6797933.1 hypothetical protein HZU73_06725 [Apis mellifera caucasica]|eukprot:XP_006560378.1 uncharacterized protein LOC100577222 isoform X1 [Apis mellifera]